MVKYILKILAFFLLFPIIFLIDYKYISKSLFISLLLSSLYIAYICKLINCIFNIYDYYYDYYRGWIKYNTSSIPDATTISSVEFSANVSGGYTENTNNEVNEDLLSTLQKLKEENYEDQLDLSSLLWGRLWKNY